MKKLLILIAFISFVTANGQQSVKQLRKRISATLTEQYWVLKDDKKVKEGAYNILDDANHVLAIGKYKNGKKDSTWTFFDIAGNIIQKFDYTDSKIVYNATDQNTMVQQDFSVLNSANKSGEAVSPYQVGGVNYGFNLLFNRKDIPAAVLTQTSDIKMTYTFVIDTSGNVNDVFVSYKGADVDFTDRVKEFPAAYYEFVPAYIGSEPVVSKLNYTMTLNISKSRLPQLYNTPTTDNNKMSQGIYKN